MYSKIINPKTGRRVNIKSRLGRLILKNYIRVLRGGSMPRFPSTPPTTQPAPTPPPSGFDFIDTAPTPPPSAFDLIDVAPTLPPSGFDFIDTAPTPPPSAPTPLPSAPTPLPSGFGFIDDAPTPSTGISASEIDALFAQPLVRRTSSGIGDVATLRGPGGVLDAARAKEERENNWLKWCDESTELDETAKAQCKKLLLHALHDMEKPRWAFLKQYIPMYRKQGLLPPDFKTEEYPS